MKESITTGVVHPNKDDLSELKFVNEEDSIDVYLDGDKIYSLDYNYNLKPLIKRMLEMWGDEDNE